MSLLMRPLYNRKTICYGCKVRNRAAIFRGACVRARRSFRICDECGEDSPESREAEMMAVTVRLRGRDSERRSI